MFTFSGSAHHDWFFSSETADELSPSCPALIDLSLLTRVWKFQREEIIEMIEQATK
jgi:hypothetical protein